MVERMVARGYERDFAERCFEQIKGFGSYGFPESHAAVLRPAGLCLGLDQMPPSGGVRLRAAQFAADGLLCAGADRARCAGAWRRGARRSMSMSATGTIALERRDGRRARAAARLPPDRRASARNEAGAALADARGARLSPASRSWRGARVCRRARCACWPMPMPSARSGSTGARRCGRCGACRTMRRCRCSPPREARELGEEPAMPAARHAARRACRRRLPDDAPVAEGPSDGASCAPLFRREGVLSCAETAARPRRPPGRARPASCWCASGRATAMPSSSRWRTRPASPMSCSGRGCSSASAAR